MTACSAGSVLQRAKLIMRHRVPSNCMEVLMQRRLCGMVPQHAKTARMRRITAHLLVGLLVLSNSAADLGAHPQHLQIQSRFIPSQWQWLAYIEADPLYRVCGLPSLDIEIPSHVIVHLLASHADSVDSLASHSRQDSTNYIEAIRIIPSGWQVVQVPDIHKHEEQQYDGQAACREHGCPQIAQHVHARAAGKCLDLHQTLHPD